MTRFLAVLGCLIGSFGLVSLFGALPAVAQSSAPAKVVVGTVPKPDADRTPNQTQAARPQGESRSNPAGSGTARAEEEEAGALYYATTRHLTVYRDKEATKPYFRLGFREEVRRLGCEADLCRVRTTDGAVGYVNRYDISNVWIRASKKKRRVFVYRGERLVKVYKADFGYNSFSDKERRGSNRLRDHWRTPEGAFYVVSKNPNSQFYKALVLNYPNAEDAEKGLKRGLITKGQYDAIVRADEGGTMPPMNTELGGWVEIHGDGTGAATNWTQGCVAVRNEDMDELWQWVQVGTPVLVE